MDVDVAGMLDAFEGMAFDKPDLYVVNDSGLKFEVELTGGGGDLDFWIGGQRVTLDCTTGAGTGGRARVALTAGSDANNPTTNYLYVTASGATGTLAASTSLPTGAFAWIGKVVVPDATTWATTGEYLIQRYTEATVNSSRGLFSHAREKLRALGAVYIDGGSHTTDITVNGGAPDNVHLNVSQASVYQLHRQTFPATATGPYYYGNGTDIYEKITDLNAALKTDDGTAIGNLDRFNLVIWGAVNYSTGDCKLYVNLPGDVYSTDADAMADSNNTADYSVPDDMRSVGFLIARIALRYGTADSGTWTELGTYSLLGTPVGARSGGAGAVASNEFDDSLFRVYDNTDSTKKLAFQVSGITTGTTRTITVPDANCSLRTQGAESIYIPADKITANTTNGPASATEETTNGVMLPALDFDNTTNERAGFSIAMPKSWNLADPDVYVYWKDATTAGSGTVVWSVSARAVGNDDAIDGSFPALALVTTDTFIASGDLHVTSALGVEIENTPASEDVLFFRVERLPGHASDNYTQDARLLGVKIVYTTNAENDD